MSAPAVVYYGVARDVVECRKKVLQVAFEAHPERPVKSITPPSALLEAVWINPPGRRVGRQKTDTVIFNSECPKVVDRFPITANPDIESSNYQLK